MSYQIVESSPAAKAKIRSYIDPENKPVFKNTNSLCKYPFDELVIGQSFCVNFDDVKESSLRVNTSMKNRNTGKKFTVIKHEEFKLFEIARIS